jgi:hypothetical protein
MHDVDLGGSPRLGDRAPGQEPAEDLVEPQREGTEAEQPRRGGEDPDAQALAR